jgi:hypothetical protein
MGVRSAKELGVYIKAYELSMLLFEASKRFSPEERYALTGQIRRSSRSVCLNLREAWAKSRYAAHFVSKLTDCDAEKTPRPTVASISPTTASTSDPTNTAISASDAPRWDGCSAR